MQETGWTNHSSFLVLYGLKKGFALDINDHFPVYWAFFGMVTNGRKTNNRVILLLLTSVRRQSFAIEMPLNYM